MAIREQLVEDVVVPLTLGLLDHAALLEQIIIVIINSGKFELAFGLLDHAALLEEVDVDPIRYNDC